MMKPNPIFNPKTSGLLSILQCLWVLIYNELKRNRFAYVFPGIILLSVKIVTLFQIQFFQGMRGALYTSAFLMIIAMTYGLLAFSSDKDKKTLDFIISRPIPPFLILSVKYGVSGLILLGWYTIIQLLFPIEWASLPLSKGISIEWLTLIILIVHAISVLAGLLSKGLERFFVVITTTCGISYLSYHIWSRLFELITANYYWYDIPANIMKIIQTGIPTVLTVISLMIPLTVAMWQLRNRIPLSHFKPGIIVIIIWFMSFIGVYMIESIFAPVLWPRPTAKYGDWHQTSGIVIAEPVAKNYEFHRLSAKQTTRCRLVLSLPNRKGKTVYEGNNLMFPRFSPDGKFIVFSEAGKLRLLNLRSNETTYIADGTVGAWSEESQQIIFNRVIGPNGLSELYRYNCSTRTIRKLTDQKLNIADLLWISSKNSLVIVDYYQAFHQMDLLNQHIQTYPFEDNNKISIVFGITRPVIRLEPHKERILLGYIHQDDLKIYLFNLESGQIDFNQEITNFRLKTDTPILIKPDCSALIWPRIDGGFTYESTKYHVSMEHELSHSDDDHEHHEHSETDH